MFLRRLMSSAVALACVLVFAPMGGVCVAAPPGSTPAGSVWFEDPLGEVKKSGVRLTELRIREATPATGANVVGAKEVPQEKMGAEGAKSKSEGGGDSGQVGSGPMGAGPMSLSFQLEFEPLLDEVKRLRSQLRENLQSVSKYNAQSKQVEMDAQELGLLVVVVSNAASETSPSWTRHAPGLRTLCAEIAEAANEKGGEAQKKGKRLFESLDQLFQGNIPEDLPRDLKEKVPIPEYLDRLTLMRRLEQGQQQMQAGLNAPAFKKQQEALLREAVVEIVLVKSIAEPGYDSATEPKYQMHVKTMLEACLKQRDAVKGGDFKGYEGAFHQVRKVCGECHTDYRTGGLN